MIMDTTLTDIQDIRAEVEEYYETAGFADFDERVLSDMSDEEVIAEYRKLCRSIEDP